MKPEQPALIPSMPEVEYHAHPALSSTGARKLLPPSTPARERAEAAEQDIRDMLYESTLLIDDALCLWCEHYDEPHDLCWAQDCKAECKWRGPEEEKQ